MRIVLFRHGPAERRDARRWPDDARRPLTARGVERTERAARGLKRAFSITRVGSSPLVRCMQSAEILRRVLAATPPVEVIPALAPGGSYRELIEALQARKSGETIALVGHEPDLGKLAAVMIFGAPAASLPLKKAGACMIEFTARPESGKGRLQAFLPPRLLRVKAKARVRS